MLTACKKKKNQNIRSILQLLKKTFISFGLKLQAKVENYTCSLLWRQNKLSFYYLDIEITYFGC